jgi:hypothetical protein
VFFKKLLEQAVGAESRRASMDCEISNGVINLVPDEQAVFAEAARVLAGIRSHRGAA